MGRTDTGNGVQKIIQWMYRDDCGRRVQIVNAERATVMRDPFFSSPLRPILVVFLSAVGRCASCGAAVSPNLVPCTCSGAGEERVLDMRLVGAAEVQFDELLRSQMDQRRKERRAAASATGEGMLSDGDVALLFALQDSLCFYCAEEFDLGPSGHTFHRDHYLAVVHGGKSTLDNTVLACPLCNGKKGEMHGYDFELMMRRARRAEMKDRYAKMRRSFRAAMMRLECEHVACIASGRRG